MRRRITAAATLAALSGLLVPGAAQNAPAPDPKLADFLFVQTAKSMSYDRSTGKLVLLNVSPVTVFFTDRPERIAGNMPTSAILPLWQEGKRSFLKNPPTANLSIFQEGQVREVVLELLNPVMNGENITYDVRVLQGEPPASAGPASLFIDVVGMPLGPLSMASDAPRHWRRAWYGI